MQAVRHEALERESADGPLCHVSRVEDHHLYIAAEKHAGGKESVRFASDTAFPAVEDATRCMKRASDSEGEENEQDESLSRIEKIFDGLRGQTRTKAHWTMCCSTTRSIFHLVVLRASRARFSIGTTQHHTCLGFANLIIYNLYIRNLDYEEPLLPI